MLALTMFKNIYDNKTNKRMDFSNWQEFEDLLYKLSEVEKLNKKNAQLISPAVYCPDATRANKNVTAWAGWAAIDVDDHKFNGDLQNELYSRFGDWYYICYSTASSTELHPKFRLVFPLSKHVEECKIRQFWFALNTEFESIGDRQTKDLSRMYYIPAKYDSAYNFIFSNTRGIPIDSNLLIHRHPSPEPTAGKSFMNRLPENIQKEIIKYRAEALQGKHSVQWTSYKDCPFVNQSLIKEYTQISQIDGTGRYAMIYRIMSSIAINAIKREYPINAHEIAQLIRELDFETSNKYQSRNLVLEADRALEFAYRNA